MDLEELLWFLQHQKRSENYADVIAAALMLYDYLLTLHLEITFVWFSPWTYTKVLFLLTRYVAMVSMWLVLCVQLFPGISESTCAVLYPTAVWLTVTGVNLAEAILAIRTWAVWNRDRNVGVGLAVLVVGTFILELVYTHRGVSSLTTGLRPYLEFPGCFLIVVDGQNFWICFVALAALEFVVFSLMIISAVREYKSRIISELSDVIHRDGILFYIYLLCLTAANAICIRVLSLDMLILPQGVLYSVLTTRIILNIRTVARRRAETELHSTGAIAFPPSVDRAQEGEVQAVQPQHASREPGREDIQLCAV